MNDKQTSKQIPTVEVEFPLPHLLPGPIQLEDGTVLAIGDQVEHPEYG